MSSALIISNIILWVIVIALALVVLALARQVGILHERVAPAGALQPTSGPKVGELTEDAVWEVAAAANPTGPVTAAPATEVKQVDGEQLRVGSGWFLEPQPVNKQSD